ncbi:MAG: hypothetical protein HFE04_01560 [Bacilli bacterium]|nr:hypothetical protein [Bacilli bacterium]
MFDISKLKNEIEQTLEIKEDIEIPEEKLKGTEIQRLENIKVTGKISRIENYTYHITLNITGNMVLLCARSLEEVDYPLNIFVDKNILEEVEMGEIQVIFQNSLDIFAIVWENIVLEVPLRIVKEDASFVSEGECWSLKDENEETFSSPLSELKDLLDMEGKR